SLSNYEVRITKEGYFEWNGVAKLSLRKRKEQIAANLSPIPAPVGEVAAVTIGTGTLSVKTLPSAAVYLNGKLARRMPVVLDEGVYTITATKQGYYTFHKQIEIKPGEKLQIIARLLLQEGSIFIDSVPRFADVIFEGQSKGKTPLLIPGLPSFQPYAIKIKKEGFAEWRGMTFTEPGERTKIMALLEKTEKGKKEPEKVHFILPKRIEGEKEEQRPSLAELKKQIKVFEGGLKFPERKIEDKIQREEIKFPEFTMDEIIPPYSYSEPELFKIPEPPAPKSEKTQLQEAIQGPGYCFITSIPAGAEILVDGRSIGKTPIRSAIIPAGKHTLIARKEGFREEKKEVTVSGENTNFFNLVLPK
ncbi:PEGA domain-containing protein, partial [bacterium]|nr:PEGA domain-containing protein [bacterium]